MNCVIKLFCNFFNSFDIDNKYKLTIVVTSFNNKKKIFNGYLIIFKVKNYLVSCTNSTYLYWNIK